MKSVQEGAREDKISWRRRKRKKRIAFLKKPLMLCLVMRKDTTDQTYRGDGGEGKKDRKTKERELPFVVCA